MSWSWSWRTVFPLFFSCFGPLLSPGFLVSMTGARYGIAFLWFRYILWWKLHFMVHWLPCSSQCSKHPFLSSGIQERDAPNHVSIGTSMHKITRWGMREFFRSRKALQKSHQKCLFARKINFKVSKIWIWIFGSKLQLKILIILMLLIIINDKCLNFVPNKSTCRFWCWLMARKFK